MVISFWLFWEMQLDQCRKFSKLNSRLTQQNASQLIITVYYVLVVWILNKAKNSFQSGYVETDKYYSNTPPKLLQMRFQTA